MLQFLWFIFVPAFKNLFYSVPTETKRYTFHICDTLDCLIWDSKLIFLHHETLSETTDYVAIQFILSAKK